MKVVFTSDGSENYDGFTATWTVVGILFILFSTHELYSCFLGCEGNHMYTTKHSLTNFVYSGRALTHAQDAATLVAYSQLRMALFLMDLALVSTRQMQIVNG